VFQFRVAVPPRLARSGVCAGVVAVSIADKGAADAATARVQVLRHTRGVIDAVVFDLDGVLVDTADMWDGARRTVAGAHGGRWNDAATVAMQGMSAPEWSCYMREQLVVELPAGRISDLVVADVLRRVEVGLAFLPGAHEAVDRLGARFPLAIASSAKREVIEAVLERAGWTGRFRVAVSAEEVARGKPSPDVYLEAVRRLGYPPGSCVAIEDSAKGVRAALAAGLVVVAVPNRAFAQSGALLARSGAVLRDLSELTIELLTGVDLRSNARREARIDEEEVESFPASDPHSDWAGPAN
jgi:HAD superfamily hydrolase (TIGR01509 family)